MVLTVTVGVLAAAVLVKIVMGPLRWHRLVAEQTRPSSPPPTEQGQVLLTVRDMAALAVLLVVCATLLVDQVGEWRTDERLYETTLAAVDVLPSETLEVGQVEALVEELTGHEVLLVDVSDQDGGVSLDDVYWAPDDQSVPVEEMDLPAPAACLAIDRDGMVGVEVTEGSCADREE